MSAPAGRTPASDPRLDLEAFERAVTHRLEAWEASEFGRKFWRKDPTLWPAAPPDVVLSRMGWIELPETMTERVPDLTEFSDEVREDGFERVVLLGMGGSSLAPEVFGKTFGPSKGHPNLHVLDSTHPEAVRRATADVDIRQVFFVVSSKSGTTLEPNSFFAYFWKEASNASEDPGQQFCAVTDSGTPLETLAEERGFRQCFTATSDVGGRYSALTEFGLVPAALLGVPIARLLDHARKMSKSCGPSVEVGKNPGLRLGAELGELARLGHDKVVFVTSPTLAAFPSWAEQLIAESTGKIGKGIVPVAGEVEPLESFDARDRLLVYLTVRGEEEEGIDSGLARLEAAGTPALVSELGDRHDLGGEFFRWEIAIAAAGTILEIDPYDQPDVERAKELAREAMAAAPEPRSASSTVPRTSWGEEAAVRTALGSWQSKARSDDYVAIQAYLAPSALMDEALRALRGSLRTRLKLSTTLGYGPRFLHSTGQLHKGGPNSGLFLQLVDTPSEDLEVPPGKVTFARILRAQADGDALALAQKGRRVLSIDLGRDPMSALAGLSKLVPG